MKHLLLLLLCGTVIIADIYGRIYSSSHLVDHFVETAFSYMSKLYWYWLDLNPNKVAIEDPSVSFNNVCCYLYLSVGSVDCPLWV